MLRAMGESDMRQERRAEANQVLQQMQQLYPTSYISGTPIDMQKVVEWWARMWDIEDEVASFFEDKQQPDPGIAASLQGGGPKVTLKGQLSPEQTSAAGEQAGIPGAPPGPNLGTTAASAVDASSPSATGGMSMSPQVMMQRALALSGAAK
jgi:hypothetical protein